MGENRVAICRIESYESRILNEGLENLFALLGGLETIIPPRSRVFIKINHLSPSSLPERAIITHPRLTREIIRFLLDLDCRVTLGDDIQSAGEDGFALSGYQHMCRALGVKLINLKESGFKSVRLSGRVLDETYISPVVLEADRLINLPKLKTHSFTRFTGAVKNMYGVIPHGLRISYHRRFHDPETFAGMLVDLYARVKPHLNIMDGILAMEGDGPASGRPRDLGLVVAGRDGVAVDAVATRLIGLDPLRIDTTRLAQNRAVGRGDLSRISCVGRDLEKSALKDFESPEIIPGLLARILPRFLYAFLQAQMIRTPRVSQKKCISCGVCLAICPTGTVRFPSEGSPAVIDKKSCIHCQCCYEVCRSSAVKLNMRVLTRVFRAGLCVYRNTVKTIIRRETGSAGLP